MISLWPHFEAHLVNSYNDSDGAAILGHEMSHELLDPVVLHGHGTVTPDETNVANSTLMMR